MIPINIAKETIIGAEVILCLTGPATDLKGLTLGGYTFRDKDGNEYQFDFYWAAGTIDDADPKKIHYILSEADEVSFPEMQEIVDHLADLTAFPECCVDMDSDEIEVERIEAFTLITRKPHEKSAIKGSLSPYIKWKKHQLSKEMDEVRYQLTPRMLKTCESYPNG